MQLVKNIDKYKLVDKRANFASAYINWKIIYMNNLTRSISFYRVVNIHTISTFLQKVVKLRKMYI